VKYTVFRQSVVTRDRRYVHRALKRYRLRSISRFYRENPGFRFNCQCRSTIFCQLSRPVMTHGEWSVCAWDRRSVLPTMDICKSQFRVTSMKRKLTHVRSIVSSRCGNLSCATFTVIPHRCDVDGVDTECSNCVDYQRKAARCASAESANDETQRSGRSARADVLRVSDA